MKKIGNVEEYQDRMIDKRDLRSILEGIRWASSAANTQPWEIYVIQNTKHKDMLDECLLDTMLMPKEKKSTVALAPVTLIVAIDSKRAKARFGETGEIFYAIQDTAGAITNIRLLAAEKGISTSWIREVDLDMVAKILKLHTFIRPVALITLGYSNQKVENIPSFKIEDFVYYIK